MQKPQFDMRSMYRVKERTGIMRLCGIFAVLLSLLISITVWADPAVKTKEPATVKDTTKVDAPVSFAPSTQVMLFSPETNQWNPALFKQTKPGYEFIYNNKLYRAVASGKAKVVPNIDASKPFAADQPYQQIVYLRPTPTEVVQVLGKDLRFGTHEILSTLQTGATIRFQGRIYTIAEDRSLIDKQTVTPPEPAPAQTVQPIEITKSALQHIIDRHTVDGRMNAGKSIFNRGENIQVLIKSAEPITPVPQARGNCQRIVNAGRNIGYDRATRKQTNKYTVITTTSGKLVTAFPGLP